MDHADRRRRTVADLPLVASSADPRRREAPSPDGSPPCDRCTALCCRYIALEIDAPVTPRDYSQIRWYLLHENVAVWVQDGAWHVEFKTKCRELQPDHRCGVYEHRPDICREYGAPDSGPCEYFSDGSDFSLRFDAPEPFERYAREQLERRERRLEARRERDRARRARKRAEARQ